MSSANTDTNKILTVESSVAFNCMYDLYFLGYDPMQAQEACTVLNRFHPVNLTELGGLKPHLLQNSVPGNLVKEYMKQTCVRFGARYVGPRGAAPQSAQTVQQPKPAQTMQPKPAQPAPQTRPTAAPVLSSNAKESLEVANTLSEKGKNLQRLSTVGVVLLILAIIMAPMIVTISMAVSGEVYFFDDELTAIFWSIDFILLGLGVAVTPLSLVGLHFIGLGQIVRNTTK